MHVEHIPLQMRILYGLTRYSLRLRPSRHNIFSLEITRVNSARCRLMRTSEVVIQTLSKNLCRTCQPGKLPCVLRDSSIPSGAQKLLDPLHPFPSENRHSNVLAQLSPLHPPNAIETTPPSFFAFSSLSNRLAKTMNAAHSLWDAGFRKNLVG